MNISETLIRLDKTCDFILGLGSLVNQLDLVQKCIVFPILNCMDTRIIENNHYFTYIKNKSIIRCAIIGIALPILFTATTRTGNQSVSARTIICTST